MLRSGISPIVMDGLASAVCVLVAGLFSVFVSLQPIKVVRHRQIEMSNLLIAVMIPCLFAFECDQGAITFLLSLMNKNLDLPVD
jgi:hypothetical protein